MPTAPRASPVRRSPSRGLLIFATVLALACLHAQAAAQNFIWKVTSGAGGNLFLVGSVHLLSASYYPLSPVFDHAFESSDLLVEELDMGEMLSVEAQMRMLNRGLLPPGQSLDKLLSPSTLAAVTKTVSSMGMPVEPLKQFKPWMLAITLQSLAWQNAGFDAELGLDRHFYEKAKAGGKPLQALETLDYQLSRFDDMSQDVQDRMLAETLKQLDNTKTSFSKMADAWKNGDAPAVERLVLQDLKSEPLLYQRMLLDRNQAWLPKIEALFSRPKPAFVVVGAAHLVGSDGLLQMLKAKGYLIEQL